MKNGLLRNLLGLQGYQWHKDKVQSEDGKKQQAKVTDLLPIAHQLGCTVAQLAIGETLPALDPAGSLSPPKSYHTTDWFAPGVVLLPQRPL